MTLFSNGRFGLISNQKINENVLNPQLPFLRYKNKEQLVQLPISFKKLKTLFIHPVGRMCYGSCAYCYNKYYPFEHFSDGRISEKQFEKFLQESSPYYDEDILFKFTGGSCFLHDNLYMFFDLIKKYTKKVNLRFLVDMMYPEHIYNNMIDMFYKLNKDPDINSVKFYISTDYGSDTRFAKNIGVTSVDVKRKALELINLFSNESKFRVEVKVNINSETDVNRMRYELDPVTEQNCFVIYNPVRHIEYSPSIELLTKCVESIEQDYETNVIYWREKIIMNDFAKKILADGKENTLTTFFKRVDENTIQYSPYYFDCPGCIVSSGLTPSSYISCLLGYIESDNFLGSVEYSKENKTSKSFLGLTEECRNCNLVGICMRCMMRRELLPCSKLPVLKFWENYIWENKVQKQQYWLDLENSNTIIL